MKRLLFSFAIMLFASAAATTAWGEPTEQETKDFIVSTMGKCGKQSSTIKGRAVTFEIVSAKFDGATFFNTKKYSWRSDYTQRIPLDKVSKVYSRNAQDESEVSVLHFECLGSEGSCMADSSGQFSSGVLLGCPATTNATLAKAFTRLIEIYSANRPKPLFE